MNKDDRIHQAARVLGSKGGKSPKTITDGDRQRRREWAKGLTALRVAKRLAAQPHKVRFVVMDTAGREWPVYAESAQHAVTMVRADGIDALTATAKAKGNEQ